MKFGIHTLGCKVNIYESEYIISELIKKGYEMCSFSDICDIYIINTCSVTNTSDAKSRKVINQARRRNKDACIVVMGCFAESNKPIDNSDINILIGNQNKSEVIEYIEEYFKEKKNLNKLVSHKEEFEDMYIANYFSKTRAFVKIQDGCENFCSFCIIPFLRGKCRSKDFEKAVKEVKELVSNGFKEIVLTGIHTGNYGRDKETTLAELMKELLKIEDLERLRISSIEINEITEDILELFKNSSVLVDHLHIPLQSGSDDILKLMNRKYNKNQFNKIIDSIRKIRPNISVTTDVIVGFPGETDLMFEETVEFIRKIGFSKLHVFPYSKRNGTKAADMKQVLDKVKKERVKKLLGLSKELELNYWNKFIGQDVLILIEKAYDNYSIGHTPNYLLVKTYKKHSEGEIISSKIDKIEYPYCVDLCKSLNKN